MPTPNPRTIQLWRRCLRCCKAMDGAVGNYYHGFTRQHIVAHKEEEDPERVDFLLGKGEKNLRFVLRKYQVVEPRKPPAAELLAATPRARQRNKRAEDSTTIDDDTAATSTTWRDNDDSTWSPSR